MIALFALGGLTGCFVMLSLTIMMSSSSTEGFTSSLTSSFVSSPIMLKSFLGEPASGSTIIFSFCFSPTSSFSSLLPLPFSPSSAPWQHNQKDGRHSFSYYHRNSHSLNRAQDGRQWKGICRPPSSEGVLAGAGPRLLPGLAWL